MMMMMMIFQNQASPPPLKISSFPLFDFVVKKFGFLICLFLKNMGVLVAHPQDCLRNPLQSQPQRMRFPRNPNPNPNNHRQNRAQPNRRKRSPNSSPPPRAAVPKNNNVLVIGQVKILRRGEEDSVKPSKVEAPRGTPIPKVVRNGNLVLGSTASLGPDPLMVPSRVLLTESNGFYAGSAFFTSPPPSSLPLPGFFRKKTNDPVVADAGSELRKLLGLTL